MAEYQMHLADRYFTLIKSGRKTVELRLNDAKRQKLQVGDTLIFAAPTGETLAAEIVGLHKAASFAALASKIAVTATGFPDATTMCVALAAIYSAAAEQQFGVLGIEFRLK